jgi:hypothetical protein
VGRASRYGRQPLPKVDMDVLPVMVHPLTPALLLLLVFPWVARNVIPRVVLLAQIRVA